MKSLILATHLAIVVGIMSAATGGAQSVSVRGRVTDLFGSPISDSLVEVVLEDGGQTFSTRTDQGGEYSLVSLPAKRLRVSVKARGFQQEETVLTPGDGEQIVFDIGLPAGALSDVPPMAAVGVVRGLDRRPLSDATVTVVSAFNPRVIERARTNKDGRYRARVMHAGLYIAHASKPGFDLAAKTVVFTGRSAGDLKRVDFRLSHALHSNK